MHLKTKTKDEPVIIKRLSYTTDEKKKIADEEIRMLNLVRSKYTVNLIEIFLFDLDICLVMEYCSNGNLRNFMEKELNTMNIQDRKIILVGINVLHSQGIVHRDLRPENILIDKNGNFKIGDFGLAKKMESKSYIQSAGTKNYQPPEAHTQNRMMLESDVWSIGVIIVEIITGSHPFEGRNQAETIQNIKNGKYKPLPDYIQGELRTILEAIILQYDHQFKRFSVQI
ncbi:MAG: putative CBL-interacting serine/threonine-protein kinase 9 [Streblomastix strix]|uniref:Putative CBL-interacting serine/threonine-protein kinase 9 n=1 Tax=Streblomastix strix TaxID=222440 RepID=A0A5J4U734_9EUKA|nr:MAG: putative CBL-interacting serine/threonine-protein kinase 9 [Streblomastix strix]